MSYLTVYTEDDVLTQLRIISFLNPSDRISTNGSTVRVQKPSALRSIVRTINNDSRANNVQYIRMLFKKTGEFFQLENDPARRERYKTEVRGAIRGLRNLQETYEEDSSFISSIDIVIETITLIMGMELKQPTHRSALTMMGGADVQQTPARTVSTATTATTASGATMGVCKDDRGRNGRHDGGHDSDHSDPSSDDYENENCAP